MTTRTTRTPLAVLVAGVVMLVAAVQPPTAPPPVEHAEAGTASGPSATNADVSDRDVYMHVDGTGLYVDFVYTRARPAYDICTYAQFWADGALKAKSNTICIDGSTGQYGWAQWNAKRAFDDGTRLCVTWYRIEGNPCATIHG